MTESSSIVKGYLLADECELQWFISDSARATQGALLCESIPWPTVEELARVVRQPLVDKAFIVIVGGREWRQGVAQWLASQASPGGCTTEWTQVSVIDWLKRIAKRVAVDVVYAGGEVLVYRQGKVVPLLSIEEITGILFQHTAQVKERVLVDQPVVSSNGFGLNSAAAVKAGAQRLQLERLNAWAAETAIPSQVLGPLMGYAQSLPVPRHDLLQWQPLTTVISAMAEE